MLRGLQQLCVKNRFYPLVIQRANFLSNDYKCINEWNAQINSPILNKINLNDFYNTLDQNYSSKGIISAIDVDVFANAVKDPTYLEELKDLLHKLRLSAETANTLESTHHATVRNFIQHGNITQLISILKDPLNFGLFLDNYAANILLDKLLTSANYEEAAAVASLVMLQEDYSNEITTALCQFASYKFIQNYTPPPKEVTPPEQKNKKVEEIKIRIKFLRNSYYDDHFDIKEQYLSSGKTLAWMSEQSSTELCKNLQVIGWLVYRKYDKLLDICKSISENQECKVYKEIIDILTKESENVQPEDKKSIIECITLLKKSVLAEVSLEESLKIRIENAINKSQTKDISAQKEMLSSWVKLRELKLEEQTQRLDRARRIQIIQAQQDNLKETEQKLWFFENEEKIDLIIEDKEKLVKQSNSKKSTISKSDENYVPPEILPKRK